MILIKEITILNKSDDELAEISKRMLLSLSLEEMKTIQNYYKKLKRNPTDVEMETLAQTWSEHCKHKIFNGTIQYEENGTREDINSLFRTYIKGATEKIKSDFLVSVFSDNAGIISFDEEHDIAFKVETHNHPSALDPYGGAGTGVGGVIRDVLGAGLGAKPIFNTDVFCFAPPDMKPPENVLHPKRIFLGVVAGVRDYGNPMGIPTINGSIHFHESFIAPLVFCGTAGIMPKNMHRKKVLPGDLIVVIGGRTGRDGVHGATFSSAELEETSPTSAVQIGSPIEEKKVLDAILAARDRRLYNCITDCGAGGFSSAVGEMARDTGCIVDLEKAPLKYAGLQPWEIWVSESQERMIVSVKPANLKEFLDVCKGEDAEAAVIGKFTSDRKITIRFKGKIAGVLDCDFLHNGNPLVTKKAVWKKKTFKEPAEEKDMTKWLKKILSSWSVCSKEFVVRQYDHEVQGTGVLKPMQGVYNDGPGDASIVRPLFDSDRGVIVSNGINPLYGLIDPYWMAASGIDEALRNIIAVGGSLRQTAILDNFCLGSPNEEKLGGLVRAAKACYDFSTGFGVPFISGKDSLHNEIKTGNKKVSVPITLLISAISVMPDIKKAVSMDFKKAGNIVYIVGDTLDELGGSQYYYLRGFTGNNVPKVNSKKARQIFDCLSNATSMGLVKSCHDCSEGGIAVALAEMAFAGDMGAEIELKRIAGTRNDIILFSESNSRFIAEIEPELKEEFEAIMNGNATEVGHTTAGKKFIVKNNGKKIIDVDIGELRDAWKRPLDW